MPYETPQVFNAPQHVAEVGTDVWYWPGGKRGGNPPRPAKVLKGWQLGAVDLSVFPVHDGAMEAKDGVFHISDTRCWDHIGNLSNAARARGVWEFAPWAWERIEQQAREIAAAAEAKAKAQAAAQREAEKKAAGKKGE